MQMINLYIYIKIFNILLDMPYDFDGDDISKIKNNTIIGGGGDDFDFNQ
jgi:hypothetical protein